MMDLIKRGHVEIKEIIDIQELLMRVRISTVTVDKYATAMKEGHDFPPVELMKVDGELYLTNGFHRVRARKKLGELTIEARISTGTFEDAQDAAAKADSHEGLARSNEDKRKVVNMLIRMDRHLGDSDRVIANMAGTAHHIVAKLRAQMREKQSSVGIGSQLKDESSVLAKPEKRKGVDGKYYRAKKKKPKPPPGPPIKPPIPTGLNRYTPEEIGWPAEEIRDQPHPEHPGYTYGQWFIHEHGHVHVMPVAERANQKRQMAMREFSSSIRKLGKAAKEIGQRFEAAEYFEIAAMMDSGGKLFVGWVSIYFDDLMAILRVLAPYEPILRERALQAEPEKFAAEQAKLTTEEQPCPTPPMRG